MGSNDPSELENHFAFGENWSAFAADVGEDRIRRATDAFADLVGADRIRGARCIDIGSGSGLHSLAAVRLGAADVLAVDLDPASVETTRQLLAEHAGDGHWRVERRSALDLDVAELGPFDVVYSWGVLHHTGAMDRAIDRAASLVAPGGVLVLALYRRTWLDPFWRVEKRWYTKASPAAQARARRVREVGARLALRLRGRDYDDYVRAYADRGMRYEIDVHDWMGGWPYESVTADELDVVLRDLGLRPVEVRAKHGALFGRDLGVRGSACDEYVYERPG